jgi:hypothetical protein
MFCFDRYHISRAFLQPKKNLLVVLEEMGGKLDGTEIVTVNRDTICSIVGEAYPINVDMKQRKGCDKDQSGHSKTNSKFGVFGQQNDYSS